jgi:hypothetical protein
LSAKGGFIHLPTGQKVHVGTMPAIAELLYFPPDEVFEYFPMPVYTCAYGRGWGVCERGRVCEGGEESGT